MILEDLINYEAGRLGRANLFYGHGTDNPLDEACYLIAAVIGFDPVYSQYDPELEVTGEQQDAIRQLVDKRITTRKPAAYLVHKAWFAGLEFYVDETVLVPRSPVAELIEERFSPWIEAGSVRRMLDIGTGSGCIAIACARYFDHARVDAVDIDAVALKVARRNVEAHGLTDRVRVIQSDLFAALGNNRYDLIIANPPYVSNEEMQELPMEYNHEPASALQSADEGLQHAIAILHAAADHLHDNGRLVLETGHSWPRLTARYPDVPFFWFEFERGGEGVCMLEKTELQQWFPGES
jgi:ribosomal protein L3 glutamine methyltransferase